MEKRQKLNPEEEEGSVPEETAPAETLEKHNERLYLDDKNDKVYADALKYLSGVMNTCFSKVIGKDKDGFIVREDNPIKYISECGQDFEWAFSTAPASISGIFFTIEEDGQLESIITPLGRYSPPNYYQFENVVDKAHKKFFKKAKLGYTRIDDKAVTRLVYLSDYDAPWWKKVPCPSWFESYPGSGMKMHYYSVQTINGVAIPAPTADNRIITITNDTQKLRPLFEKWRYMRLIMPSEEKEKYEELLAQIKQSSVKIRPSVILELEEFLKIRLLNTKIKTFFC